MGSQYSQTGRQKTIRNTLGAPHNLGKRNAASFFHPVSLLSLPLFDRESLPFRSPVRALDQGDVVALQHDPPHLRTRKHFLIILSLQNKAQYSQ